MRYHLTMADFFFFNDTATTEIYTLSLHDALPICAALAYCPSSNMFLGDGVTRLPELLRAGVRAGLGTDGAQQLDRKSTRLDSSHDQISHAVFCLQRKCLTDYSFEPADARHRHPHA